MYQLSKSKIDVQNAFLNEPIKPVTPSNISFQRGMDSNLRRYKKWEPSDISHKEDIDRDESPTPIEQEPEPPIEQEPEPFIEKETEPEPEPEPFIEKEPEPEPEPFIKQEPEPPIEKEPEPELPIEEESEPFIEKEDEDELPIEDEEDEPYIEKEEEYELPIEEDEPYIEEEEPYIEEDEPYIDEDEPYIEENITDHALTYDYRGETYFVDNLHFLQRHYNFPEGEYMTNLCIYKCIRQGEVPYLLYLTVYDKSSKTLVFPTMEDLIKIGEEDPEEQITEAIKTTLFDIFPPAIQTELDIPEETPADIFDNKNINGFFLTEENIWLVYDATRVAVPTSTDREYFWISPFEALILYKFRSVEIDTTITSFFKTVANCHKEKMNDVSFYTLKRASDGEFVPAPYIMYPCSPASTGFFGLSSVDFENIVQEKDDTTINLLIPYVQHPQIGNFPMFSAKPIDPYVPKIKRYAVFVDYEVEPTFMTSEETKGELDHLYDVNQTQKFSSISFLLNGRQYWSIKSPLYMTEIYDDTTFLPSFDNTAVMENLIKPFKQTALVDVPPSNADDESNEDIEINEDISVESDTESNDESEGEGDRPSSM